MSDFDAATIDLDTIEFGIGTDKSESSPDFWLLPISNEAKSIIVSAITLTLNSLANHEEDAREWEPSEQHASRDNLYVPTQSELATLPRNLHEAINLEYAADPLADAQRAFCYFARVTDSKKRRLTAMRRATQFKALLKAPLLSWISNELTKAKHKVFKIDHEFDLLVDDNLVRIWNSKGFEALAGTNDAILAAVAANGAIIQEKLDCIEFDSIIEYAQHHIRAARLLASIKNQPTDGVDAKRVRGLCAKHGIPLENKRGPVRVSSSQVIPLLEVLDRRRYDPEIIDTPELFRAGSRRRV